MKTIIALDFDSLEESKNFVKQISFDNLQNYAKEHNYECIMPYLKVGMWQYYTAGNDFLKELKDLGFKIFLDLKLIDIPNTIYNATKTLLKNDIDILSLHSFAGEKALKAAVNAKNELNSKCELFGISVLTSFSEAEFKSDLGFNGSISECVKQRTNICKIAGLDGIVSSAYEAEFVKSQGLKSLTPGIRFKGTDANDQARVATPKFALENNIDYIVAGRMITKSTNPIRAYFQCLKGEENE